MKEQITYDIFEKIDIRLGTVNTFHTYMSKKMKKLENPSLVEELALLGHDIFFPLLP